MKMTGFVSSFTATPPQPCRPDGCVQLDTCAVCVQIDKGQGVKGADEQLSKCIPSTNNNLFQASAKNISENFEASPKELGTERDYGNIYSRHKLAHKLKVL